MKKNYLILFLMTIIAVSSVYSAPISCPSRPDVMPIDVDCPDGWKLVANQYGCEYWTCPTNYCPYVPQPADSFCQNGKIVPKIDSKNCITSYECQAVPLGQGHNASEIRPGTFQTGRFVFPASSAICLGGTTQADCIASWGSIGSDSQELWSSSGSNVYYDKGMVGIGTTSSKATLLLKGRNPVNISTGVINLCRDDYSQVVTGVGTHFLSELQPGDVLVEHYSGITLESPITNIVSDTQLYFEWNAPRMCYADISTFQFKQPILNVITNDSKPAFMVTGQGGVIVGPSKLPEESYAFEPDYGEMTIRTPPRTGGYGVSLDIYNTDDSMFAVGLRSNYLGSSTSPSTYAVWGSNGKSGVGVGGFSSSGPAVRGESFQYVGGLFRTQSASYAALFVDGKAGVGTDTPNAQLQVHTPGSGSPFVVLGLSADSFISVPNSQTSSWIKAVDIKGGNNVIFDVRGDGNVYADGTFHTPAADYAEWFEKEEDTEIGDLIGLDMETGLARKYKPGDRFIGIHSDKPSVIGNNVMDSETEMEKTHVLVGLLGQLDFDKDQVKITGRVVTTADGEEVGLLLSNGKVLLGR